MFESLAKDIKNVFLNPDLKGFAYLSFLVLAVVLGNYVIGFSYYYNLDGQLEALERLQALNEKGVGSEEMLTPLYENIATELRQRQSPYYGLSVPAEGLTEYRIPTSYIPIAKVLSATFLYILYFVYAIFLIVRGNPDGSQLLIAVSALLIVIGLIALIIPTIVSIWVNVILYLVSQVISIVAFSRYGAKLRLQKELVRSIGGESEN